MGTYNGLICLQTPLSLALAFTSGMLGMEVTEFDDDVRDAIGEIANMTAGSFKQHLSSGGADIKLSIPSVVTGRECSNLAASQEDAFTFNFAVDGGSFLVCVVLEKEDYAV
jgi:chemotaxis protein CheX